MGLIEAASRFDPNRGVRFITFNFIRQDALHNANGGYLILDARKL